MSDTTSKDDELRNLYDMAQSVEFDGWKRELKQYGIQERIDENNMWYYKIQNAPLSSPPYIESKEFYERNAELTTLKDKEQS